jgi:hypothetical protein
MSLSMTAGLLVVQLALLDESRMFSNDMFHFDFYFQAGFGLKYISVNEPCKLL